MFWIQCWLGACNFIAFSILFVSAYLLICVLMDENR
jgi:hypothetical protein